MTRLERMLALAVATCAQVGPAQALTPLPPCEGLEAGMTTHGMQILDPATGASGVVVEAYQVDSQPDASPQGVYADVPAPVSVLDGFYGVRVTHCPSGEFFAIKTPGHRSEEVVAALSATEFLRGTVQAGNPVGLRDLAAAIRAVYGKPIRLKETAETCGCHVAFPGAKPAKMTPYAQRTDVKN